MGPGQGVPLGVTEGGTLRRVLEVSGDILPLDLSDQQFCPHRLAFESSNPKLVPLSSTHGLDLHKHSLLFP